MNIDSNLKRKLIQFFKKYRESLLNHILFDPNLNVILTFRDKTLPLGRNKPELEPLSKAKADIILKDRNHWIPQDGNFFVPQSTLDDYFNNPKGFKQYIFLGLLDVDDNYLWNNRKNINWNYFCLNKYYYWTKERIKLFEEYINFKNLSFNCNIELDKYIINEYLNSWDWNGLSGNPSVSHKMLINSFSSNIIWRSTTESIHDYYSAIDEVNKNYFDRKFGGNGALLKFKDNFKPSLSTNPGIYWENILFDRVKDKVDFWQIARYSNFSTDILKSHFHLLNENRKFKTVYARSSDWHDQYLQYRNGWENLAFNKNYFIGRDALNFLSNKVTKLVRYDGDAKTGFKEKTVEQSLLFILKPSQVKINFLDLVKKDLPLPNDSIIKSGLHLTENNNFKYFVSSNRIHEEIYKRIISPVISSNPELFDLFIQSCIGKDD